MKKIALLLLLAGASLYSTVVAAEETKAPPPKITKIFDRELPNVPGKSMRVVLVEYGPGAASPSHRHPSSAFIYATVLEGEVRSKSNDAPEHVYKTGESRTELPGDHHAASANASSTKPAQLLAIFVVDTAEKELVIPDKVPRSKRIDNLMFRTCWRLPMSTIRSRKLTLSVPPNSALHAKPSDNRSRSDGLFLTRTKSE